MDWADSVLDKRKIIIPDRHIEQLFKEIEGIEKTKKINKNIVSSLSKGRWLLGIVCVENRGITIISPSPEEIVLRMLKEILYDGKVDVTGKFSISFMKKLNKTERDIIVREATASLDIKIKTDGDEELSYFRGKIYGRSSKKPFLKFLEKFLKTVYLASCTVENINLALKNSNHISIDLTYDSAYISGDYDRDIALKTANSLFKTRVYEVPFYTLAYLEIEEIESSWEGPRKGVMVLESGTFEEHGEKRFEFRSD